MNSISNQEARIEFSNKLATALSSASPTGTGQYLARAEAKTVEGATASIVCPNCPYLAYSFHESSLHARLHPN